MFSNNNENQDYVEYTTSSEEKKEEIICKQIEYNNEEETMILDENLKNTYFLNYEKLMNMDDKIIKKIIINTPILIFIDEYKFQVSKYCCIFHYIMKRRTLINQKFPGCLFISYDFKNNLLNIFDNFKNNNLFFDEGLIFKNTIYQKMEITNNILFIPLYKYKLKYPHAGAGKRVQF